MQAADRLHLLHVGGRRREELLRREHRPLTEQARVELAYRRQPEPRALAIQGGPQAQVHEAEQDAPAESREPAGHHRVGQHGRRMLRRAHHTGVVEHEPVGGADGLGDGEGGDLGAGGEHEVRALRAGMQIAHLRDQVREEEALAGAGHREPAAVQRGSLRLEIGADLLAHRVEGESALLGVVPEVGRRADDDVVSLLLNRLRQRQHGMDVATGSFRGNGHAHRILQGWGCLRYRSVDLFP